MAHKAPIQKLVGTLWQRLRAGQTMAAVRDQRQATSA
jgi:hypothetical protein